MIADYRCKDCGETYPFLLWALGFDPEHPLETFNGDYFKCAKPHGPGCLGTHWNLVPGSLRALRPISKGESSNEPSMGNQAQQTKQGQAATSELRPVDQNR